jgi:hypothetical protein
MLFFSRWNIGRPVLIHQLPNDIQPPSSFWALRIAPLRQRPAQSWLRIWDGLWRKTKLATSIDQRRQP